MCRYAELKTRIIHEAIVDILKPLCGCESVEFASIAVGGENWMCFPIIMLHCCSIMEGRDVSCIMHELAMSRIYVTYVDMVSDIRNLGRVECRTNKRAELERSLRLLWNKLGKKDETKYGRKRDKI